MKNRCKSSSNIKGKYRVIDFSGGRELRLKLSHLGIMPGEVVEIISGRKNGAMVVKVKDSRIILGCEIHSRIHMQKC